MVEWSVNWNLKLENQNRLTNLLRPDLLGGRDSDLVDRLLSVVIAAGAALK